MRWTIIAFHRPAGQTIRPSHSGSRQSVLWSLSMTLRAVKRKRIHEDIVAQIRRHVVDGRLRPGDRLPSERALSARFQVSRASLREAIRTLESTGLVQIRSGDGTYVASNL